MEESTSWKNHSFTLLIFGGIVVVCSIFFALGMLVGRSQGRSIAETAFAEEAANQPATEDAAGEFPLNYYSETTSDKPDLTLQPPDPPPAPRPDPPAATPPAPKPEVTPAAKSPAKPTAKSAGTLSTVTKTATAKATAAKTAASPVVGQVYLQIRAYRNQKQAYVEQKQVQSKGFKVKVVQDGQVHRVLVGPYAKSAVNQARADLKAKGYGDVVVRQ